MARIMIVEDEKQMREIIVEYMRRGGHSCQGRTQLETVGKG